MDSAYTVLIAFALWTLLWLIILIGVRMNEMRKGNINKTLFAGIENTPPFLARVGRVHANCLEILPILTAIILVCDMSGEVDIISTTAIWIFFGARMCQSLIHAYSTTLKMSLIRGLFFFVQIILISVWGVELLLRLAGV